MSNYVYILKCSDDSYYTGYTNNLENRIKKHNNKKASKYTRIRVPVKYVFIKKCIDKIEATKFE
ncbi:GIY-YIG nuclease family protein, partial [Helcococcus ovis]